MQLRRVHPLQAPGPDETRRVRVEFERTKDDALRVRFGVEGGKLNVNPALPADVSQWGLWEWDVVELFVGVAPMPGAPCPSYFEFQVSPLNQYLELQIFEPRLKFDRDYRSGLAHRAWQEPAGGGWGAELVIPARALGWKPGVGELVGNAFAILGSGAAKTYWSLHLPPQEKPDFHLPEYFRPIFPA